MATTSEPDTSAADAVWVEWMRANLRRAAEHFGVEVNGEPVLGLRLLTANVGASSPDGPRWLRVRSEDPDGADGLGGDGNVAAQIVVGVPMPRVLGVYQWDDSPWEDWPRRQRAELMTVMPGHTLSRGGILDHDPGLPAAWWDALVDAIAAIQATPTVAERRQPGDLSAVVREALGVEVRVRSWQTAHGDLHWANLMVPFAILDWETFGQCPTGTDEASLLFNSLTVPSVAKVVQSRFGHVLDSEDGRVAQLILGAYLMRRVRAGGLGDLGRPLWQHLQTLGARGEKLG